MRLLILLGVVFYSFTSWGITKGQFQQQMSDEGDVFYSSEVKQHESLDSKLREQRDRHESGGGNVCATSADCDPDQFCRRVNYKPNGLCVEKQR